MKKNNVLCTGSVPVGLQKECCGTAGCQLRHCYQLFKTVQPIFIANCTARGCHDATDLPSLAEYYVANDAAQQIRTAVVNGVMPKYKILSAADKTSITCWIDNGAKNN